MIQYLEDGSVILIREDDPTVSKVIPKRTSKLRQDQIILQFFDGQATTVTPTLNDLAAQAADLQAQIEALKKE
jgi:hypothetical protein